jgi:hypothetical protein
MPVDKCEQVLVDPIFVDRAHAMRQAGSRPPVTPAEYFNASVTGSTLTVYPGIQRMNASASPV